MGAPALCHVLGEDVGLLEAVPVAHRERAIAECIAATVRIPRGHWSGQQTDIMPDGIGLLVLDGLLIRRVGISGSFGAELLGEGDLLRPWQGEDAEPTLSHTTGWKVLQQTRVAVLDRAVAHRFARYPELTGRLVARGLERSRNLAMNMAIVHQSRIHVRLHMLLWHLADRWGFVRADGTVLPLRLTHSVLADLVAAQRPTVTMSLAQLAQDQLVQPLEHGWLLLGEPPGELLALQDLAPATDRRPLRLAVGRGGDQCSSSSHPGT
jgi:CRP/FNR family transcriptional regulator, cyclic AMP receptor protein